MIFTETPEFDSWLNELILMPSTPIAENLYADTPVGRARLANLKEYFHRMALLAPDVLLIGRSAWLPGHAAHRCAIC